MIAAIVYAVVSLMAALVLGVGGMRYGLPAYNGWKLERCRARIVLLERDLGMVVSYPELLPSPGRTPRDAAERWSKAAERAATNYTRGYADARRTKPTKPSDEYRPPWRRY